MNADVNRPVVLPEDASRAREAVEAWAAERPGINVGGLWANLATVVAEARYAGYEDGMQAGRRIVANVVKEALHDEGLL